LSSKLVVRYIPVIHMAFAKPIALRPLKFRDPEFTLTLSRLLRLALKLPFLEEAPYIGYGYAVSVYNRLPGTFMLREETSKCVNALRRVIEASSEKDLKVNKDVVLQAFQDVDYGGVEGVEADETEWVELKVVDEPKAKLYVTFKYIICCFLVVARTQGELEKALSHLDEASIDDASLDYIAYLIHENLDVVEDEEAIPYPIPLTFKEIVELSSDLAEQIEEEMKGRRALKR